MLTELFVGNLNPDVCVRDLENCFGRYGKVLRCDLKKNYAFLQFAERRDAEMAIQKENNRSLLGSEMTVEFARGKPKEGPPREVGRPPFRKPHSPRFQGRDGPPMFNSRHSPPPRRVRDRSPVFHGRDRSPIAPPTQPSYQRSPPPRNFQVNNRNFSPRDSGRDESFTRRRSFEQRDSFHAKSSVPPPRNGNDRYGPPPRDRMSRDRPSPSERPFSNRGPPMNDRPSHDRSNRGPTSRINNGFDDRRDRFYERRESFGERRPLNGHGRF